jgi:predicted MPP superfamily phosphohydrolase
MRFILHHLPDVFLALLGIAAQFFAVRQLRVRRSWAGPILLAGCALLLLGFLLRSERFFSAMPVQVADLLRPVSFLTLLLSLGMGAVVGVLALIPRPQAAHSPERRLFLNATRAAVLATPAVAAGYGVFIQRADFHLNEVTVPIRGLPQELNGLRLVQLSDIHLSPFLSERELARAVDIANETKADLALVTGDLVTSHRDPLDACIKQLSRLRASSGIIGCLGNHEVYARAEDYTTQQAARFGMRFLRDQSETLEFRGRPINFTGVDYQRMHDEYLQGTQKHIRPGMPNILLSHNPDVFRTAAAQGFDLTISGHTHGGQITFEILDQNLSVARFYTPYVSGLYREGDSSVFVTRGIGTVGVPARLGARPEVALIRLCAI